MECKRVRLLDKPAMKAITEGCQTAADVDVKNLIFITNCNMVSALRKIPEMITTVKKTSPAIWRALIMMMRKIRERKRNGD